MSFDRKAYALRSGEAGDTVARLRRLEKLFPWYRGFLKEWLPDELNARMLDVPCGLGNLLYCLHQLGYTNLLGVDGDRGQVAAAVDLALPAQQGDAFDALNNEAPGSVHRIFSVDFLEHLPPEEALRFCSEAFARLAPGGWLLCRTPSADGPFGSHDRYNDLTHKWGMTSSAGHQLLQLAGFDGSRIAVRQEAPVPYQPLNVIRRGLFRVTTAALGAWLELCGIGAPRIWTRSMWLIAQR